MKKTFVTLLICFIIIFNSKSQNLVSNPSFETTYSFCGASSMGDIYLNDNLDSISSFWSNFCLVKDWMAMTETPDIFSYNSFSFNLPTSDRYCKYIKPHSGNNIVGASQYEDSSSIWQIKINTREIFENKLIMNLKQGHKYKLSFYVQLFDSVPLSWIEGGSIVAINSFSVFFSNSVLNLQSNTPLPMGVYQPQIQINQMVTDTQHWVLLSDTFTAKGGERYMAVGNFKPDSLLSITLVDSVRSGLRAAYYFYDDFSLIDLTPDGVDEVGKGKLVVYPNPVSNVLICQCANMLINTIEITDVLGRTQMVRQAHHDGVGGHAEERSISINVETLPSGIYFIKAIDTNGNIMNGKFVKE
jgi:hypothetical protein